MLFLLRFQRTKEKLHKTNLMKILHTSDWHLGKKLGDYHRLPEQKEILEEITTIADKEKADLVIISGDLFDTFNPPAEAVELFYKNLKKLSLNGKRPVIAIAGNHDSPERIELADPLARECGIIFIGFPNTIVPLLKLETGMKIANSEEGFVELYIPDSEIPVRILHTAYANEFRLKAFLGNDDSEAEMREILREKWKLLSEKYCDQKGINLLISHLFFVKEGEVLPEEPEDEKPIVHVGGAQVIFTSAIPGNIQYTALGHLHRKQFVDKTPCPVCYSGSPLAYSFSEANQKKYVICVDAEPGKAVKIKEIELQTGKKLLRYRAENIENALEWLCNNEKSLVELTLVSDTYISAQDRRQLYNCHKGIISIVPEIIRKDNAESEKISIDLTKNITELFVDYFKHEKGQEPNEKIMKLFKEVLSEK